jgi:hypothetical protein
MTSWTTPGTAPSSPAFSHFGSVEDPREAIMARLRELGIPHKKNEKLETLKRKLDA